jgi:tRNA dimethylallyltransferase
VLCHPCVGENPVYYHVVKKSKNMDSRLRGNDKRYDKQNPKLPSILVILGPTASGKSDLAVALARMLNGEVISADSRQVYKGLNLGSGKITKKEMKGVPHHLLDVSDPKKRFTVNDYQKLAYQKIDDVIARGKLPIVCGGTGFYIQSIVDGIAIPNVKPDKDLRNKLNNKNTEDLYKILKELDVDRYRTIDKNNKIRIIRAIEIAKTLGKNQGIIKKTIYDALQIGIYFKPELLRQRIEKRLQKRIKNGMIKEVINLHKKGISWKRMEELGLEYRYLALFLQKKITKEKMMEKIKVKSLQYAKRQMTWFKKDKRIWWIEVK